MNAFGLTGNIGCGKSTVATLLSEYQDISVFDCDQIAKEIIATATHRDEFSAILGKDVFFEEKVDFRAMAKIVFEEPEKKRRLEALVHPLVWATVQEKINSTDPNKICIVESAIIFETGSESKFPTVIVATCNRREQFRRLRENRGMDDAQIQVRIAQQLPSSEKEQRAHFVIHTDCNIEKLKIRVEKLYKQLKHMKGG